MDIITLVQVVLRRWWLLVLLGLVGLVSAYVVSTSLPKHYQSTVTLQLNASAKSAFLPYTSETSPLVALAASYSEVLRSRAFGEVVVQRLQLPVSPDAVAGAIKAQQIPNTNILRITVQWDHPQDARQLAQSVAEIFISENLRRQQAQPGAQSRLAEMEESVRTLQTRIDVLAQQRNRLDQAVARGDLSRLAELKDIETRLSGFEASYANLLVEINRIRGGLDTAAILDNATPGAPAGDLPLQMALLLGLFGGLGVAVGVAFGLEYLGDALQGPEEVVAVCGSAPFAAVSHIGSRSRKGGEAQATTSPLVLLDDPRSPPAEAIRALRTNLRFATLDRPLGTLVVTSPGPNEGKTLIASNLAIAWAKEGKRVLLVDADLRRPSIHTLFGIENTCGFTEAIAGIADCGLRIADLEVSDSESAIRNPQSAIRDSESAIRNSQSAIRNPVAVPSRVEHLSLLPSGHLPPEPNEVLGSAATARVIAELRAAWDVVVIDTAPVGPVADTLPLAALADGVLVIARSQQTRRAALRSTLETLRQTGGRLLGVVLNDLRPSPLARYSAYAYYYHGYYYQSYYGENEDGASERRNGSAKRHRGHRSATSTAPSPATEPGQEERP